MSSASSPPPSDSTLSGLLSSTPHLLAYSIPLLLLSVLLTFAGTFLTLDRSRSFPPSSYSTLPLPGGFDSQKKRFRFTWFLQGGVGGLATGYIFGLHLSSFLTLLIPSVSTSASLSPNVFLTVWILSCILTTILSGRYKYCALLFSSLSGGALLGLALSVIVHPPLLSRIVLVILFSVAFPIAILVFSIPRFSRFLHRSLRIVTSSTGAFSLILSIALLAHIPAWANVWERLWMKDGESWGSGKEASLSAAFCIFVILGMGIDWLLKRRLGACPDEKWDKYLAQYTTNFPSDSSRAGTFKPLPSLWERLFHPNDKKDIVFPASPKQARSSISKDGLALLSGNDDEYGQYPVEARQIHNLPVFPGLCKTSSPAKFSPEKKVKRTKRVTGSRGRKPIKFDGELTSDSSLSDSELSDVDKVRPWPGHKVSMTSSTPTLVGERVHTRPPLDYDLNVESAHLKLGLVRAGGGTDGNLSDYSDYEGDLGLQQKPARRKAEGGDVWSPGFLKRHSPVSTTSGSLNGNMSGAVPIGAVPATPSLIEALDRVSEAQREAFGVAGVGVLRDVPPMNGDIYLSSSSPAYKTRVDGLPRVEEQTANNEVAIRDDLEQNKPGWDDFWRDVTERARS